MRALGLCIISFISLSITAQAQSPRITTRQWQSWYGAEGRLALSSAWRIRLELENDRNQFFSRDNQYQGRLSAYYRPTSMLELGAGFGYFGQDADSLNAFDDPLGTELRPHQEVVLHLTGSWLTFKPALRIEERFLRDVSRREIDNRYDFNYRFRLRLEANTLLRRGNEDDVGQLQAIVYNEVMVNAGRQASTIFNQNRTYIGLNHTLSKSLQVEAGYQKVVQQRSSGNRYWNRDVLRLSVYYSWKIK